MSHICKLQECLMRCAPCCEAQSASQNPVKTLRMHAGPMIGGFLSQPCDRWPNFPLCENGQGLFAKQ